ncbi:MAG: hypothetical protein JSW08_00190 [archaeon]|nr:MAG: hypothetical protein JSW08_00190 [archaeon]
MKIKRGGILLIILVILMLSFTLVQADEATQLRRAYSWLRNKALSTWTTSTIEEHVFSILALQDKLSSSQVNTAITALLAKSQENGTHWNNNAVQSALAKIALDRTQADSTNVSQWLLTKNASFSDSSLEWYLQLTQPSGNYVECYVNYDNSNHLIKISKEGVIQQVPPACLTNSTYWFRLTQNCIDKTFVIECNDSIKANFLFKRGSDWYVTGQLISVGMQQNFSIGVESYCITENGVCSYQATLWTAYAFHLAGAVEIANTFVPYLIIEEDNPSYQNYLPQAFLYTLTSADTYADEIAELQGSDGYISLSGDKYYDSSLAKMTGSAYKANLTLMEEKLLFEQNQAGYWHEQNSQRDTAMILYSFWPSESWISQCESQGYRCVSDCSAAGGDRVSLSCGSSTLECCSISSSCESRYGTCKPSCSSEETRVSYICRSGICCKDYSRSLCVAEIGGSICGTNQECTDSSGNIIGFVDSSDSNKCCKGTCTTRQQTCSELGGEICDPIDQKSCSGGNWLPALEMFCCRQGSCVQAQLTCSAQGGDICSDGQLCKDGVFIPTIDTNSRSLCCIQGGRCLNPTCEFEECDPDETCSEDSYETGDALKCCEGSCLRSCSSMRGEPCESPKVCDGNVRRSSDVTRCCIGECKEKSGGFPIWIIIVIIVAVVGVFFFMKMRKKGGKKPEGEDLDNLFGPRPPGGFMPPRRPMPRKMPPSPPRPPIQQKLKKHKDLRETLKNLKDLGA